MAKLTRKSAKVFAEQANAAVGGIAQFGSLAAGDIQYSKDVDVIQARDAYKEGWASAVVGNKSPAMEDRNALDYLLSYQQAYIMQHGIPEWLSTETYYKNCFVVDSNGDLRVSLSDNNTGHDPAADGGNLYWGYSSGSIGHQIGEVYWSQSKEVLDNPGSLPLFTGELISNANNVYPQFYAWLGTHSELCKTQAEYDTAISTYGECPYYVLNTTNKTIRLPKLVNFIKNANTTNGITQSLAGLPNITGTISSAQSLTGGHFNATGTGALGAVSGTIVGISANTASSPAGVKSYDIDASRSSAVYGRSNTVTPAHTTLYPWVCVFNSAVPASTAQATQFQAALTSKADVDLTNVDATGTSSVAGWAMPSDIFDTLTLGASETMYTAPANGFFALRKAAGITGNYYLQVELYSSNDTLIAPVYWFDTPSITTDCAVFFVPVKKGQKIKVTYTITGTNYYFRFIYAEGSKSEQ